MNQRLSSFYHQIKKKNLINFSFSFILCSIFLVKNFRHSFYTEMFFLMAKMFSEETRKELDMKQMKKWLNKILLSLCLSWTFLTPHYPKVDHSHKSFLSDWCKLSLFYIEQVFECSQS